MKKILILCLIFVLFITWGCTSKAQDPANNNQQVKTDEPKADTNEKTEQVQVKQDSGRYIGRIDSNFIEIKISGVPDEKAARVFKLSDELKEKFDKLGIKENENVLFSYKELKEHKVIIKIEKIQN